MKNRIARHGISLAVLLCVTATAQADDQDTGHYIMTVYLDMAQGRAILDGSPGELIESVSEGTSGTTVSLEENMNLCVAYTQAKQVEHATAACDAALAGAAKQAKTAKRTSSVWIDPAYTARNGHAMALNNRGVLHALTGDHDAAREMFEAALEVGKRKKYVRKNLALLNEDLAAAQ